MIRGKLGMATLAAWAACVGAVATRCGEPAPAAPDAGAEAAPAKDGTTTSADGKVADSDGVALDSKVDAPVGSDTGQPTTEPTVTEKFWVIYNRVYRLPGGTSSNDYILTGWKNPAASTAPPPGFGMGINPGDEKKPAIELTKVAFKTGGFSCAYGCFISPDLKWMAVAKGPADGVGNYTYGLGAVNNDLTTVGLNKDAGLTDIKHLVFAGNYLFYSKKANCLGTGKCQYDIHRRGPLGSEALTDDVLTKMAPDNDPDVQNVDTIYNGYFRASADGSTLSFLTPTIRSQRLYVWRGGNLAQLDYICPNFDGAKCVGTGSEYSDRDPLAVSVDGKQVVMFATVDRWLRARKYLVGTETPSTFSNLVEVPAGKKYKEAVCAILGPEQHAAVAFDPQFSLDGKRIWFVGLSKCSGPSEKQWTDVMSLEADKIGSELGPDDWINWTKNPRTSGTKNKVIQGFAMSPGRQVAILTASATISSSGTSIPDTDQRQKQDTELYSLVAGGSVMVPITNENAWHAYAPATTLPLAAP